MFLEISVFYTIKVSKTGRKINLNSDARYRFERGLDQDCPKWVHNHVTNLVLKICGGEVSYPQHIGTGINWKREIKFNSKRVYELTGVKVENKNISEILNALGFTVLKKDDLWTVTPAPWRNDIDGSADLVEEIIRIYGYENIPEAKLFSKDVIPKPAITRENKRLFSIKSLLAGRGMMECITYSFISFDTAKLFSIDDIDQLNQKIYDNYLFTI